MTRTKTRALANWPNNAVNVLDYGAVGDGVTDDTAAIRQAFASISNGMSLLFPPGSYRVTSDITLTGFKGIKGSGPSSTNILFDICIGS